MRCKFLFLTLLLTAACAFAADKIAYLDMQKLFKGYYRMKQENYQFEIDMEKYQDRLQVLQDEYDASYTEAEKARSDAENDLHSEAEREESQRRFRLLAERVQAKEREIYTLQKTDGQALKIREEETTMRLVDELTAIVKTYAANKGYDTVIEVSGLSTNRIKTVLMYPTSNDITDACLKLVNEGHETELKEAEGRLQELEERIKAKQAQKLNK